MAKKQYVILMETREPLDTWLDKVVSHELDQEMAELQDEVGDAYDLSMGEQEELATDYTIEGNDLVIRALIPAELYAQVTAPQREDADATA